VLISEIFHSLQGEGPCAGLPAAFIRLSGCVEPLCPWCDTPYALAGGTEMDLEPILRAVSARSFRRAVITGGEPFLQWDAGLSGLHEALISQGIEVQYETSGKIRIPIIEDALVVCSPKHIAGAWRFDEENVRAVHVFKFTADGTAKGFEAIDGFIAEHGLDAEKVCIMPLGATRREQLSTMEPVFAYCLEKGYRMSPRLQVLTFDTRRGI
jgi:7-carboxy-7-deazaguanine synthase